ncbi:MAG: DUF389 domain-containing protein [Bacteroidetes bacterium]|nr:MAG: DUF389 domain-containing protein [Bacteroidota bacterium]TNE98731.1 MAG: DUF389 domain-containing protein [Bacteroidota bacterium]
MENNRFISSLIDFLRLHHEVEDHAQVKDAINKGVEFRGTNAWILIFAILVASVGLNMNSTAVIIGAMLISPLMGPITGVGFSVATYDFLMFRRSLKNLGYAVSASLLTSFLYFSLSPIRTEYSELLARTSPTIYDVLIATFGGLAGVVALTSKNKGNVIPGVAIATALMPPLCTAGYGLAIGNWAYFFGALYLFIINSVFIALSAMVVTQVLKFPRSTHLLTREIKNKNIAIAVVISLTVLPSLYLGYTLVKKEKFNQLANQFIQKVYEWEGNYLLKYEIDPTHHEIDLVYGGNKLDSLSIKRLEEKAEDIGMKDFKLSVIQGLRTDDYSYVNNATNQVDKLKNDVESLKSVLSVKDKQLDSLNKLSGIGEQLLSEIKPLFPEVYSCVYARSVLFSDSLDQSKPKQIILFEADSTLQESDKIKIKGWLKKRLPGTEIEVRF